MQRAYDVLEIEKILGKVAAFSKTARGKARVLGLKKLAKDELSAELSRLEEASIAISLNGHFPIPSLDDLESPILLAKKGGVLNESDLWRVNELGETIGSLKRFMAKCPDAPLLNAILEPIDEKEEVGQAIRDTIGPNLEVKDSASPELRRIRGAIARLTRELSSILPTLLKQYGPYLSEATFSMREGHYVLPIADTYKHKVKGIVYGLSNSGSTTWIEPTQLVERENRIAELGYEEKEEIRRILAVLSSRIGDDYETFLAQNEAVATFDFLQAKALYGEATKSHIASLSEDGSLFIAEARHPLLDASSVIPNSFSLSPSRRVLVISGPNAGGKTVALKTLGVVCYMFALGLMVPCLSGAMIPYFKRLLVDIGDSQSIEASLSTFSGHMSGIAEILSRCGGADLVLLDEIGTGTSPKEGEALAISIVQYLLHKHAYALVSSHFEGLKAFAMSSDFIENACMGIDPERFTPTYRLHLGIPGESYGLKVAERLGLPKEVIASSEKKLKEKGDFSLANAIKKLSDITKENEALNEKLKKQELDFAKREKAIKTQEKDIEKRKENLLSDVKATKEKMLEEAKEKIDEALKEAQAPNVKQHELAKAKRKLRDLEEQEAIETFEGKIEEGDYVIIPDYGIEGVVSRKSGKQITVSTSSGASFKVDESRAKLAKAPEDKKEAISGALLDLVGGGSLPLEINLIGMRYDEAKEELSHYLDQCRLKGFKRVRVIHGFGSGALRKMTAEYLKANSRFVEKFEAAGEFEGGSGATVVYLK